MKRLLMIAGFMTACLMGSSISAGAVVVDATKPSVSVSDAYKGGGSGDPAQLAPRLNTDAVKPAIQNSSPTFTPPGARISARGAVRTKRGTMPPTDVSPPLLPRPS